MKRYAIGAAALAVLAVGGFAYAAIPSSGESAVISGCYEKNTGLLRVIDAQAGKACTKWETAISWSQKGPKGDQGVTGSQGAKGDTGAQGATGTSGAQGDQGLQGSQGPAGAKGDQGQTGPQGANGDPGPAGAPGAAGAVGPKGDPGAGVTWFGDYVSGIQSPNYPVGSLVRRSGAIWIALQQTNGRCNPFTGACAPRPGEDDNVWKLFAQDGAAGEQGQQGAQGSPGSQGPAGPQGVKGDTGSAGPQGPAGGAVAGYEIVRNLTIEVGAFSTGGGDAICPAGKKATGGGVWTTDHNILDSSPKQNGSGWAGRIYNGNPFSTGGVIVYAICVNE